MNGEETQSLDVAEDYSKGLIDSKAWLVSSVFTDALE